MSGRPRRSALVLPAALCLLLAPPACPAAAERAPLTVTHVAGAGCLFTCDGRSVLVDALFDIRVPPGAPPRAHDHPDAALLARMTGARPPFDAVALVLATHGHDDHFTPGPVADLLRGRPGITFLGPPDVVLSVAETLEGAAGAGSLAPVRTAYGASTVLEVGGATVVTLGLRHSGDPVLSAGAAPDGGEDAAEGEVRSGAPGEGMVARDGAGASPAAGPPPHQGYLISLGGHRILHLGDAAASRINFLPFRWLAGERIDVACVPYWILLEPDGRRIVREWLAPAHVVVVHTSAWNREEVAEELAALMASGQLAEVTLFREPLASRTFP